MQPISSKLLLKDIWDKAPAGLLISNVVTDSREVSPGCVFVAIKGEQVDGHSFAAQAFQQGAALVLAQRPICDVPQDKTMVVDNVLNALISMAGNYRHMFSPLLLAITGSVGKTTTKEFSAAIFSAFGETLKTQGNQNNEIGMSKTLLSLTAHTRYAAVEMGMQAQGEIRKLALAAQPAGAIITNIGHMHLEFLGNIENVLRAKMEVTEGVAAGGPLILNADDPRLCAAARPAGLQVVLAGLQNNDSDVKAFNIRPEAQGLLFDIADKQFGGQQAFIPCVGRHNVQNALLAYTAATRLGLNSAQAATALAGFCPAAGRQGIAEIHGITLIKDYYNAGPESMQAALETMADMPCAGRRIAVLGDMLELGSISEKAHKQLGYQAKKAGIALLISVGNLSRLATQDAEKRGLAARHCQSKQAAAQLLLKEAKKGDIVLLKASRGMKFEEIADIFEQKKG